MVQRMQICIMNFFADTLMTVACKKFAYTHVTLWALSDYDHGHVVYANFLHATVPIRFTSADLLTIHHLCSILITLGYSYTW